MRVQSWVGKTSWRRTWQPTSVFLPKESSWTEEPGGLQPKGSERIGHDWSNWASKPNLGRCCLLTKLCLTLCDPMDCSSPDSSVRGISQVRILEWVAIFLSNGTSDPGIELLSLALAGRFFTTHWATREAPVSWDIASQIALRNCSKEKVGKG